MRIRTLLTLTTGAALGAGATYLLDPEHGEERRRDARRYALRHAREGALRALGEARERAEQVTIAAVAGYRQARAETDGDPGDGRSSRTAGQVAS